MVMRGVLFFFFKQKTAYEMRISDWSSDVCSSDLDVVGQPRNATRVQRRRPAGEARHREIEAAPEEVDGADLAEIPGAEALQHPIDEIGRASWRERVCQYV